MQGLEPTLRALNALWFHAQRKGTRAGDAAALPRRATFRPPISTRRLRATASRCRRAGRSQTAAEAAAAAEAIGFPVALKIVSPDILHKTEAGGVVLDLRSRDAVAAAADALVASARAAHPGARIDGFLVQEMVLGRRGDRRRAQRSRSTARCCWSAPAACWSNSPRMRRCGCCRSRPDDVTAMIDGLKLNKLLAGFRGRPPADRAALERDRARRLRNSISITARGSTTSRSIR